MTGATRSTVEDSRAPLGSCVCGARHSESRFAELGAVRVLDAEALEGVVVRWPEGVVIDVRSCDRCGGTIARLVTAKDANV
jgi:hypothetical protein